MRGLDRRDVARRALLLRDPLGGRRRVGRSGRNRRPQSRFPRVSWLAGRGLAFACAALPLHLIYYCCCGLSVVIAQYYWYTNEPRSGPIALSTPGREPIAGPPRFPDRPSHGGRAGCRAGVRDRNNREIRPRDDSHQRPLMKIGIDGSCLSNRRGFGRFARQLLARWRNSPASHQFTVFVDGPSAEKVEVPASFRAAWSSTWAKPRAGRRRPRAAGAGAT